MAEHRDLRARRRPRPSRLLRRVPRPDGRGARRRGGRPRHGRRRGRADPLDDRRDERREPRCPTGGTAAGSSRRRHEHAGGLGPLYALRDRDGVEIVVRRRRRRRRRRRGRSPPSMPRSRPARGWSRSRTCCGRPARSCRSRRSRSWPTRAARWSSSTARRPPARSRSGSTSSAPTSTPCRPRSGCSARRGWARSWSIRASIERLVPALGGWFSFERATAPATPSGGRTPAGSRRRLPSPVGRRDGPLDRLAVDVRRSRVRLPARDRRWPRAAAGAPRRDPGRHRPDPAPTRWRRSSRSGSPAGRPRRRSTSWASRVFAIARTIAASTRSGSASASSTRTTSSSGSPRRSSCSRRTRPRRCRRAATSTILGDG